MSDGPEPMMDGLPLRAVWFAPVGTPLPATVDEVLHSDFSRFLPSTEPEVFALTFVEGLSRVTSSVTQWSFAMVAEFGVDTWPSYRVVLPDVHVGLGDQAFRAVTLEDPARVRVVEEYVAAVAAGEDGSLGGLLGETRDIYESLVGKLAVATAPDWRQDLLGRPPAQLAAAWRLQVRRYTDEVRELGRVEGNAEALEKFRAAGGPAEV